MDFIIWEEDWIVEEELNAIDHFTIRKIKVQAHSEWLPRLMLHSRVLGRPTCLS